VGTGKTVRQEQSLRYGARDFTRGEVANIRALIASGQGSSAAVLAREVCRRLDWRRPDGELHEAACRGALTRMVRDGLLPPWPRRGLPAFTGASDAGPLLEGTRGDLGPLALIRVSTMADSRLWTEVIARHHYLGYRPLVGAQLRYLIYAGQRLLAALGFASAAWRVLDRDDFIGWDDAQRLARLRLVVNNARFLIMPAIRVRRLASSILGQVTRQLPLDWERVYGYKPVLAETFVESDRFSGTSYRAANWEFIGETTGRGKFDRYRTHAKTYKSIWLYPLDRRYREILCAPLTPLPGGDRP